MLTPPRPEIMEALTAVFREVLDEPALTLREDTTADDVASWDSLNHIDLIVAVERKFKVKFTTREIASLRNVGELATLIQQKPAAQH
ncbi:MAG TPA: acyl carrier protein [Bryobacteraceae bacterium]|nr:acyl carrier protein [Bryobacteraceae bacterium]